MRQDSKHVQGKKARKRQEDGMRVLIVDDYVPLTAMIRDFVLSSFQEAAVETMGYLSGALVAFRDFGPDVLIVDGDFPDGPNVTRSQGMNGAELVKFANENGFKGQIIGIPDCPESARALREAGVGRIVQKPFSTLELMDVVRHIKPLRPVIVSGS